MWHSQEFSPTEYALVHKLVSQWPASLRFPAVDMASILVHHPHGAHHYVGRRFSSFFNRQNRVMETRKTIFSIFF